MSKIDFHDIDSDEESHGSCDRGLVLETIEEFLVAMKTLGTGFCVSGVEVLQQRPWQEGVATQVDTILVVHLVPSRDFQGESPRSGLHWLYLAIALLKALFWNSGLSSR